MTVKVAKKPVKKLKCVGCDAVLEFEFTDLIGYYPEYDYTEAGPEGVGVKCPDCKDITEYKNASRELIEEVWAKKRKAPTKA